MSGNRITIDEDASSIPCPLKGGEDPFSAVIKRRLGGKKTMEHLAAVIEAHPLPPALLDAMEAAYHDPRKDLPREVQSE